MLLPLLLTLATSAGFEKNLGQTDPQVRYLLRSRDVSVFLTDRETVFRTSSGSSVFMESAGKPVADSVASSTITSFVGPRERWREDVPVFDRIRRREVFPGIDMVHYGAEYDYVVARGANPRAIAVRFRGQRSVRIDEAGALVFNGDLRHERPVAYQKDSQGNKTLVDAWFQLRGDVVTFGVGDYDRSRELVIDPEFASVRFEGGAGDDSYIDGEMRVGVTNSIEFPWAFAEPRGGFDVFIRFSSGLFYFGGSGDERPLGITAVDQGIAVFGETTSVDLPTGVLRLSTTFPPSFQWSYGGGKSDGFVVILRAIPTRPFGTAVVAGYVGGRGTDRVVAATNSRIFLQTDSTDLPAPAFGVPPSSNYIVRLSEPWGAGYFPGSLITAASDMDLYPGVTFAGTEDGEILQVASNGGLAQQKKVLEGPIVQVRTSTAGWGLVAASNTSMVRLNPQTLATEHTYALPGSATLNHLSLLQNYALFGGKTTAQDIKTVGAPQAQYGGGNSDGFFGAIDLESAELKLWSYAGGDGDDEVLGIAQPVSGSLQVVGTSNSGWGGTKGYGGLDAFVANFPSPILQNLNVPGRIGQGMQLRISSSPHLPLELLSEDATRLAVAKDESTTGTATVRAEDGEAWLQSFSGSGATSLTITSPGYWPAKFRIGHFVPYASFVTQAPSLQLSNSTLMPVQVEYARETGARTDAILMPGIPPATYRIYSPNPAVAARWPDYVVNFAFTRSGVQEVLIGGRQAGTTEIRLEGDSPVGGRTSIPIVTINENPASPGGESCIVMPGYSLLNRPAPASPTDEMVTLRSERPGELQFASDLNHPLFRDQLTVASNTRIRVAASSSAKSGAGIVYSYPDSSRVGGRVGCRVASPGLSLAPFTSELQLRNGPQRLPFALIEANGDRVPIPVQLIPPRVSSSDSSVIEVDVLPDWSILLTPHKLGNATIRLERAGIVVMTQIISVRDGRSVTLNEVRVGRDLQTPLTFFGFQPGTELTIESEDPSRVLLSTSETEPGRAKVVTIGRVWVQALSDAGTVTLRAYGGGYSPTTGVVRLYPSTLGVGLSSGGDVIRLVVTQAYTLFPRYFALVEGGIPASPEAATPQTLRAGLAPARVRFESTDSSIVTVSDMEVVVDGNGAGGTAQAVGAGEARIRMQVEGFSALPGLAEVRVTVSDSIK